MLAVERLEAETPLVTKPALIDRVRVHTEESDELSRRGLRRVSTADRARGAGRLHLFQIPGSRLEAIRCRGQRANGTDLDGVAGKVGVEGPGRDRRDLDP